MTDRDDTPDVEPETLASELEHDADEMQERSEELDEQIGRAAKDWEAKRADPDESGAPPPEDDAASRGSSRSRFQ